jgi:phosphate transport system substrate-binding protein
MKRKSFALVATLIGVSLVSAAAASAATITGAGSSLVNPIVQQFIPALGSAYGYNVTYASVGSGTGIADISNSTVDFGASDAPMTATQAAGCVGCVEVPWVLTGTTLAYNVPGAPDGLHLSGSVILGIYEGTITNWDAPQIAAINPGVTLPNLAITPIHRSDGSGDTYAFTNYLSDISPGNGWAGKVGYATSVVWPTGPAYSGNSGVAAAINSTSGAIGYVSASYSIPLNMNVASIKNADGVYVAPTVAGFVAAADAFLKVNGTTFSVNSTGVEIHIVNAPKSAKAAYPLSTYSNIIFRTATPFASEIRHIVYWVLTRGDKEFGPALYFAPNLPSKVLSEDEKTLDLVSCASTGCQ